jgi:hypothetical protein
MTLTFPTGGVRESEFHGPAGSVASYSVTSEGLSFYPGVSSG